MYNNLEFLIAGYLLLWVLPFGLIAYIIVRTKAMDRKISELEKKFGTSSSNQA